MTGQITKSRTGGSVTVLIAAYNAAEFISRAIRSALEQIPPPLEVVVVDDKSTDLTISVVQALAEVDARIKLVILPENLGPAGARNAGLDAAQGEWVAVLDADDAYLPGRLAALLQTAGTSGAEVVADNFRYFDARTGEIGAHAFADQPAEEIIDTKSYLARSHAFGDESDMGMLKPMFRKAFLDAHGLRYPQRSRHGEDFLFVLDILLAGGRYVFNRTAYYLYTTRDSGMSRTPVDYDKMGKENMRLLDDPRIAADGTLRDLVGGRIHAVRRLSAERKVVVLITERRFSELFRLSLSNQHAARAVWRRVRRRLGPRTA